MNTKLLILPILLWLSILASWCTNIISDDTNNTWEIVWMANPASVHCEENWWTLELVFDNGESYGMCHFDNGEICEEREFFRKECFPATEKTTKNTEDKNKDMTICTMDAKLCPDWSYVWRTRPDCKFESCPTQTDNTQNQNDDEETITEILENHTNTSWYQEEWLTEADIDLMEAIIEKLK